MDKKILQKKKKSLKILPLQPLQILSTKFTKKNFFEIYKRQNYWIFEDKTTKRKTKTRSTGAKWRSSGNRATKKKRGKRKEKKRCHEGEIKRHPARRSFNSTSFEVLINDQLARVILKGCPCQIHRSTRGKRGGRRGEENGIAIARAGNPSWNVFFDSSRFASPPTLSLPKRERERKKKKNRRPARFRISLLRDLIYWRVSMCFSSDFSKIDERGWEMRVLFFINESSFPFAKKREDLIGKIIKFRNFNVDTLRVLKFWKGSRYLKLISKWNFEILEIFTWYSRSLCYNIMQNDVKIKCNII